MFPEIKTQRLLLRQIESSDQPKIFEGLSHPEVIAYYGVSYGNLEATKAQITWYESLWATGLGIWWAISSTDREVFYGACGFNNHAVTHKKAEIGFWLLPEYWKKGIVQEAVSAIVDYGFNDFGLHRIEAFVEVGNSKSKKALKKLKFNYEGTMVDVEIKNGQYISLEVYARLKDTSEKDRQV